MVPLLHPLEGVLIAGICRFLVDFSPIEEMLTQRMGNIRKEASTKRGEKSGKKRRIPAMRTPSKFMNTIAGLCNARI